ncbi:hypothetical protein BGZ94_009184 [Podila epigama]|nr:hypothetical protein BGZ94_009184 [Podila epigama]
MSSSFGQQPPSSHGKAPLNAVFIIDTHQPNSLNPAQVKLSVLRLKKALLRILLFFQSHMDERFQWSYQFYDSHSRQDIAAISNRPLQILSESTFMTCMNEYAKIIEEASAKHSLDTSKPKGPTGNASPSANLRMQLVHSLSDFGLGMASYQSPVKPAPSRSKTLQKHFPPVAIRSYMYVLSPLPRTWEDTVVFLAGKKHQEDMTLAGPRTHELLDVLQKVKSCFFDQALWDRFLDNQLSLSWIDTSAPSCPEAETPQTRISASTLIRSTMELIMKAFGGRIIPYHVLTCTMAPENLYSFATIFQSFTSTQITPGLGVKLSKANWQPLPSVQPHLASMEPHPLRTIWSGDIYLLTAAKQLKCKYPYLNHALGMMLEESMSKASVPNDQDQDQDASHGDIQSICVTKRVPRSSILAAMHSNDVLLLEVCYSAPTSTTFSGRNDEGVQEHDKEHVPESYTRQAILYPTTHGSGLIQFLETELVLERDICSEVERANIRSFQMTMTEKRWCKLGGFVEVEPKRLSASQHCRLSRTPASVIDWFKNPQPSPPSSSTVPASSHSNTLTDTRSLSFKPVPGQSVDGSAMFVKDVPNAESIDDICLGARKAYLEHLYDEDYTVVDYLKKLNAASKEITALAAKQSVALKDAQQKLVAFMIEFLRIWPSRMTSKYKQIGKEVNVGKLTESKTQDNYAILDDERPQIDTWKRLNSKSAKDSEIRASLKKLKTKDIQIQIVQNLLILLLINKYGLEENRPFKKDPGAAKAVSSFMDDLCISASIDDRPVGLMSPQTPRSKGMDPAKKFFTKVISRYYGSSLPKIVEKLSIKCGVEKSLLLSPRPVRIASRPGMSRSISMGVLQRPKPLDLSSLTTEAGGPGSSSSLTPTDAVAPKHGFPMSRQSTSENARSVLNSSIFRNRQVTMTMGSVKGVPASSSTSSAASNSASLHTVAGQNRARPQQASSAQTRPPLHRQSKDDEGEEQEAPRLARLKLKKFYHDRESEEMLKAFRRKGPLSKADQSAFQAPATRNAGFSQWEDDDDDDDDDLGPLAKYLPRGGTTTWGAIQSSSSLPVSISSSSATLTSPSPSKESMIPRSPPLTSRAEVGIQFVPSTPTKTQSYSLDSDGVSLLRTPTSRQGGQDQLWVIPTTPTRRIPTTPTHRIPTTPTRRDRIHQGHLFASQIRGLPAFMGTTGSLNGDKRRRIFNEDDDDDDDHDDVEARQHVSTKGQGHSPELTKKMRTT